MAVARITAPGSSSIIGAGVVAGLSAVENADAPTATSAVDDSVTIAAFPPPGVPVTVGFEVWVGGVLVPLSRMRGGVTVSRSLDRALQEWQFAVSVDDGRGFFGSPFDALGPAMGNAPITIYGIYLTPSGVHRYPLITNGVADSSHRYADPTSSTDGYAEEFSGTCGMGRFDRQVVTYVSPAGAGYSRDYHIARMFSLIGDSSTALEGMHRVDRELQFVDADPVTSSQALADVEHRKILRNRYDQLVNPRLGARFGYNVIAGFAEGDMVGAIKVEVTHPGDVITDVTLVGSQQLTKPAVAAGGGSGRTSATTEVEVDGPYEVQRAAYSQSSACTLTSLGGSSGVAPVIPRLLTITTVEQDSGVVVSQRIQVWSYRWVQGPRYTYNATGDRLCLPGVYLDSTATESGSEPGYAEPFERWRLVSDTLTRNFYDKQGLDGPVADPGAGEPWGWGLTATPVPPGGTATGYKLGSVTDVQQFYAVKRALKARDGVSGPWDGIDAIEDVLVNGAGEGLAGDGIEDLRLTQRTVQVDTADGIGKLQSSTVYHLGFDRPPGDLFWYTSTFGSSLAAEIFRVVETDLTSYASLTAGQSAVTTVKVDANGNQIGDATTTIAVGDRPDVDRIQSTTPATPGAATADPSQNQPIKVRVTATGLLLTHQNHIVKTTLDYPENVDELVDVALAMIEEGAAAMAVIPIAANFQLAEGDWIHVRYLPLEMDQDMQIRTITHQRDDYGAQCLTTLLCSIYPSIAGTGAGETPDDGN